MSKIIYYICPECGFHGADYDFDRHTLSEAYDYGHNNAEPAEVELQCPDCGLYEQDGIVVAGYCDYCDSWHIEDNIWHLDNGCDACLECKTKRDIMMGATGA